MYWAKEHKVYTQSAKQQQQQEEQEEEQEPKIPNKSPNKSKALNHSCAPSSCGCFFGNDCLATGIHDEIDQGAFPRTKGSGNHNHIGFRIHKSVPSEQFRLCLEHALDELMKHPVLRPSIFRHLCTATRALTAPLEMGSDGFR